MLQATPLYAGLLALLFVGLSARVILARRTLGVSLGDGGEADLLRRMRVHGNCAEYAPIGILLLAMAELQGMPVGIVHLLGATLFLGRVSHAWSMSRTPQSMPGRVAGMGLTLTTIALLGLANIAHALV